MEQTNNLKLPYLLASQAQKHVTHNEALRMLDGLVHASVRAVDVTHPPTTPQEGDAYIPSAGASGAFEHRAGQIGVFADGAWFWHEPREGWHVWNEATRSRLVFTDGAWTDPTANTHQLGINTDADIVNRLSVRAHGVLLSAEAIDHRLAINKTASEGVSSILFQTAFEAKAELGLVGNDAFSVRTSWNGSELKTAIAASGDAQVYFPATPNANNMLINGLFEADRRLVGDGAHGAGTMARDRWKAGAQGATITQSDGGITLASGSLIQRIEVDLWSLDAVSEVTFSAEIEPGGSVDVSFEGQTKTLAGGPGRSGATFSLPAQLGSVASLELASNGAVLRRTKLERGPFATPFMNRLPHDEDRLLDRYCQLIQPPALGVFTPLFHFNQSELRGHIRLSTKMRTAPVVTFRDPGQFRIVPIISGFALGFSSVDEQEINLVATHSENTVSGAGFLLRSALSGTAAIVLEAEL